MLIDGGTFLTSADVCAQLRSLTKSVFVGEETGGASAGLRQVWPLAMLPTPLASELTTTHLGPPNGLALAD